MRAWTYIAYSDSGKRAKGVIVAATEAQATADLRARGLFTETLTAKADAAPARRWRLGQRGPNADMRAVFLRQLAVMLEAGLTVEQALEAIAQSDTSPQIEALASQTRAGLMSGYTLADSLTRAQAGYPAYCLCALQAGEEAGRLVQVTGTLADYIETLRAEQTGLATVLIYPAFVASVAVLVAGVLLRTVAPELARLYESTDQPLPQLTRVMMAASDAIFASWPFIIAGLLAIIAAFLLGLRRPAFRDRWHRFVLRLPLLGRFKRLAGAAQYLRTLAVLVQSKQPIVPGMQSACAVLDVADFRAQAEAAATAVQRGQTLSQSIAIMGFIPAVSRQLIGAGEASGRLGHMTDRAAAMVENTLTNERKRVAALIEPLLMVLIGGMVLTIVLAVLLPIFDLQAAIAP